MTKVTIICTLKTTDGKPLSGQTLYIYLRKETEAEWNLVFTGKTDKNGQVTTTLDLEPGTYMTKAVYPGSTLWDPATKIAKFTVPRETTKTTPQKKKTRKLEIATALAAAAATIGAIVIIERRRHHEHH